MPRARYLSPSSLALRAVFALTTGGIVMREMAQGEPHDLRFTAVFLLPACVFVVGVWRPFTVFLCGILLVGFTAYGWIAFHQHARSSTGSINIVVGALWSLGTSLAGAVWDFIGHHLEKERLSHAEVTPDSVEERENPPPVRRRAW